MYSDDDAAALYDLLNPWGPSDDFHLRHVMAASSVLDVGCGTGMLLHRARGEGHTGRLCGVDPDTAALARARSRTDASGPGASGPAGPASGIEWVAGTAASMSFDREFAHALMASNAFQCLVTDDELRASLAAVRAALVDGGTFAFETRNPLVREWDGWNPDEPYDVVDHHGRELRMIYHVEAEVGDVVTFTETTATRDGTPLRVDRASLRFLSATALDGYLSDAGFTVSERYGDFAGGAYTPTSETIVTVARRK
ncbi:class I SAM-dependent methyltransferase [Micromonospora sp. NPDC049559]|uniref:class I SAM-dependent methyltransferase n=1 Tax=Micromonospora sp. NPDC049559 TaxID=3155923 RepID=UPI00344592A5